MTADVVVRSIQKVPEKGKSEFIDKIELHNGGCACNTAVALAKIGIKTGVMGKVGRDGFGDFLVTLMSSCGLDLRGLRRNPNIGTSSTVVLVSPDGERTFLHYSGANASLTVDDIDFNLVREAKILHVAPTYLLPQLDGKPTAQILKKAKEMGLRTSLDTAWDARGRWLNLIEPSLQYIDIFLPSLEEARMISGRSNIREIARFFRSSGVKIIGLKTGKKGCYILAGDKELRIPAFHVKVVDTTGAGDGFVAGFLTGIVKGWDLRLTGEFANAVGGCVVTSVGAAQGIKSLDETLQFMKTTPKLGHAYME
jgi:sugar/nucleoside kinase (ribokinase family)